MGIIDLIKNKMSGGALQEKSQEVAQKEFSPAERQEFDEGVRQGNSPYSMKTNIERRRGQPSQSQTPTPKREESQQTPLPKESPKSNAEQAYENFKANAEKKYSKVKEFAKNVQSDVENISQESINRAAVKGGKIIAGSAIIAAKNLPKNLEKANTNRTYAITFSRCHSA